MRVSDFEYDLPQSYIAQTPATPRDASKLMVLSRNAADVDHRTFADITDYLQPNDLLVFNNTRVLPARIMAKKKATGGKIELLLLKKRDDCTWEVLAGGKRVMPGLDIAFALTDEIEAVVTERLSGPRRVVRFSTPVEPYLELLGQMPLPPYISARLDDQDRYQTVYAETPGSAAAPTAGLHFTDDLLATLREQGVNTAFVTLSVGLDTFAPVTVDDVSEHVMHAEWCEVSETVAALVNQTRANGGRVIAVGTTTVRTLESAAKLSAGQANGLMPFAGDTRLFITPGFDYQVVDGIITNFHLPKSTLLMMISAFLGENGRERLLTHYETAKLNDYRFFSFGDAMFIR